MMVSPNDDFLGHHHLWTKQTSPIRFDQICAPNLVGNSLVHNFNGETAVRPLAEHNFEAKTRRIGECQEAGAGNAVPGGPSEQRILDVLLT